MTSITIELPDDVASQAALAGLLDQQHLARLLRAALRNTAKADLQAAWKVLERDPIAPLTEAELDAAAQAESGASWS